MAWYKHTPTQLGWFWRGTQSAIFFYVSCTPCLMHSAKVKQRKENKRAMAERDQQMRLAEGMFYTQPLPFQTNEAWRSEIELGRELPLVDEESAEARKQRSRASSYSRASLNEAGLQPRPPDKRGIGEMKATKSAPDLKAKSNTKIQPEPAGRRLVTPEPGDRKNNGRALEPHEESPGSVGITDRAPSATDRAQTSGLGSAHNGGGSLSTTIVADPTENSCDRASSVSGEDAHGKKRRGQRPLEPLWGITDGFGPPDRLDGCTDPEPVPAWYVKRNPEVNELHPPVVSSLPRSKKEALWMLQPPPPAAFMEGRVQSEQTPEWRTATSRSASRSTRQSDSPRTRREGKSSPRRPRGSVPPPGTESLGNSKDMPRRKKRPAPLVTIASEGM